MPTGMRMGLVKAAMRQTKELYREAFTPTGMCMGLVKAGMRKIKELYQRTAK